MPETISVEGFVRSVSESGLLSEADLRATFNGLGGEAGVSDARMFARSLVDAGRLTPFQVDAIMEGRAARASYRQLRRPEPARGRRHGHRLQGPPPLDEPDRRAQGPTERTRRTEFLGPALSARGRNHRPAQLTPTSSWPSTPVRTTRGCTW